MVSCLLAVLCAVTLCWGISMGNNDVCICDGEHVNCDLEVTKNLTCPETCLCCLSTKKPGNVTLMNLTDFNSLVILGQREGVAQSLVEEVDSLLSQLLHLTSLLINNTNLGTVPTSVCSLRRLEHLFLDHNFIEHLDPTCFSGMKNLTIFEANHNHIQSLQEGLFKGLANISDIRVSYNKINEIGVSVFGNISAFPKLMYIDLSWNGLEDLDPWPIVRFASCPNSTINVEHNQISKLTNKINWNRDIFDPKQPINSGTLKISNNSITHLHWFLQEWKLYSGKYFGFPSQHIQIEAFDNPLHCDCMVSMSGFAQILFDYSYYHCTTPELAKGIALNWISNANYDFARHYGIACNITNSCPLGCKCMLYGPEACIMDIIATQSGLTDLPDKVPELPLVINKGFVSGCMIVNYRYFMYLSNNKIPFVTDRYFLKNTTYIDLRNNRIKLISEQVFHVWEMLMVENYYSYLVVNLTGNELTIPPTDLQNMTQVAGRGFEIDLRSNPWTCDCHAKWFKQWIFDVSNQDQDPFLYQTITCGAPKKLQGSQIYHLSDADFVCGTDNSIRNIVLIIVGSVLGTVLLLTIPTLFTYYYRLTIFARFKWRIFDRDECHGEDMVYDVFISYASDDEEHVLEIYNWLSQEEGYRCCIHKYDFEAGSSIMQNISQAIQGSKRTLCFLSPNFLQSQMCMWEFEMAMNQDIHAQKRRLIAVLLDDFKRENIPDFLEFYLAKFTYVEYDQASMRNKILYNLPSSKLGPRTNDEQTGEEEQCLLDN